MRNKYFLRTAPFLSLSMVYVTLLLTFYVQACDPTASHSPAKKTQNALIIDNSPDLATPGVLRTVVEQLEQEGVAIRSDADPASEPSGFYAEITMHAATNADSIRQTLLALKELGITRTSLKLTVGADNHVIVHAPADVSWHRVRRIEQALAGQTPFFVTHVRVAAQAGGDFSVQFIYDGPKPVLSKAPVTRDEAVFGAEVADESLLVGDTGELANVVVYVTSADIPVHPELQRQAERPAELTVRRDGIRPRILPMVVSQTLKLVNDTDAGINFNWAARRNSPVNVVVAAKGGWEGSIEKAENRPTPVTDSIHPWLAAYLLPLDHPYAAVSGADGIARLTHLPEGKWTFRFWHEKGGYLKSAETGESEFSITIEPGEIRRTLRVSPEFLVTMAEATAFNPSAIAAKPDPAAPTSPATSSNDDKGVASGEFKAIAETTPQQHTVASDRETSIDDLRKQFGALEQRSRELAARLHQPTSDPATSERMKNELRDTVSEAFHARLRLQRAELADFTRRLEMIQRTIELRDRLSQQIINRRVEELLDGKLQWQPTQESLSPNVTEFGDRDARRGEILRRSRDHTAELSLGARDGVRVGDALRVVVNEAVVADLEIFHVEEGRSQARIVRESFDTPVRRGDAVTRTSATSAGLTRPQQALVAPPNLPATSPSLILGDSAEEMHERLTRCSNQVAQLRSTIQRHQNDDASSTETLMELQSRLDEHLRKQKLAIEEYRQQILVLEAAEENEHQRLDAAEQNVERIALLYQAGRAAQQDVQQARQAHSDAFVALQTVKALLSGFRQAGEGLVEKQASHAP